MKTNSSFTKQINFFLGIIVFIMSCSILNTKSLSDSKKGSSDYPKNILITNDDGIMDKDRLYILAKAVSKYAEQVIVVVSSKDRSGTSNYETVYNFDKEFKIESTLVLKEKKISMYVLDGYPADCVILGALGIFYELSTLPDLVISGINGGQNEGHLGWFGSGTVGAARTAAHLGFPAIAVSGIDEDKDKSDKKDEVAISNWIAAFIKSKMVQNLKPCEYLTISVPKDYKKIQGVKIVKRQRLDFSLKELFKQTEIPTFYFSRKKENEVIKIGDKSIWKIKLNPPQGEIVLDSCLENDIYYLKRNFIVIVPMRTDENNYKMINDSKKLAKDIPPFIY